MSANNTDYKTPLHKLVPFFKKSRDKWKEKYMAVKEDSKRLINRLRRLEESKNKWKKEALELRKENKRLRDKVEEPSEPDGESEEQKNPITERTVSFPADLHVKPFAHQYPLIVIELFTRLVLDAAAGLRTSENIMSVLNRTMNCSLPVPSWYTGRIWLMKLGYWKLTAPKTIADDWAWIVDFTIQSGTTKVFVIFGIRLKDIPAGQILSHEDIEPIDLVPLEKANGDIVYTKLEEAVAKTGVPRVIISDAGSDIKSGIKKFCAAHVETSYIYDGKNKIATLLKSRLEKDERWGEFCEFTGRLNKTLRQTPFAHLTPTSFRIKARYMNLDSRIRWAESMLGILKSEPGFEHFDFPDLEISGSVSTDADTVKSELYKKAGQLIDYTSAVDEWSELLNICIYIENTIRTCGYIRNIHYDVNHDIRKEFGELKYTANKDFLENLLLFIEEQQSECKPGECLPGSTEVLESVLGKQKYIEGEQSKSGFTGLVLGIAAIVSKTTSEIIRSAMEMTPVKTVLEWQRNKLGPTLQARRMEAFGSARSGTKTGSVS